jgi:hypothetical protein
MRGLALKFVESKMLVTMMVAFLAAWLGFQILFSGVGSWYFLVLLLVFLCYMKWRFVTLFIFVWIIAVGAIRKWVWPEGQAYLFFSGHLLLLGAYLRFYGQCLRYWIWPLSKHPINKYLAFLLIYGLLETTNPNLPTKLVALFGIFMYFSFVPIAYMLPSLFSTKDKLLSFLKFYALISLPLYVIGFIQYFSPAAARINRYARSEFEWDTALVGDNVRVTSTFPYITGYTVYLSFVVMIIAYLLSLRRSSRKVTLVFYTALTMAIVSLFMAGSRAPLATTIMYLVLYLILSGYISTAHLKPMLLRFALAGLLVVAVLALTPAGQKVVDNMMSRIEENAEDVAPRIVEIYTPFRFLSNAGPFGFGIGSTCQGTEYWVPRSEMWGSMSRDFENEPERILLELGLVGFILTFGLRLLIIKYLWDLSRRLKDNELRLLALAALLFHVQFLHTSQLTFNMTAALYYWFTVGFLFLLPKLDSSSVEVLSPGEGKWAAYEKHA